MSVRYCCADPHGHGITRSPRSRRHPRRGGTSDVGQPLVLDPYRGERGDDPIGAGLGEYFDGNVVVGGELGKQGVVGVWGELDGAANLDRVVGVVRVEYEQGGSGVADEVLSPPPSDLLPTSSVPKSHTSAPTTPRASPCPSCHSSSRPPSSPSAWPPSESWIRRRASRRRNEGGANDQSERHHSTGCCRCSPTTERLTARSRIRRARTVSITDGDVGWAMGPVRIVIGSMAGAPAGREVVAARVGGKLCDTASR